MRAALALLAALAASAALTPGLAEGATPRSCLAGPREFVVGPVRVFAMPFHGGGETGSYKYACLGARGRPMEVGLEAETGGTGSRRTPAYALGGQRYLGVYEVGDGEGGPDAEYSVYDLRTRRVIVSSGAEPDFDFPVPLRVAEDGSLLSGGEFVYLKRPGHRAVQLADSDTSGHELALRGGTAYWTERGAGARSVQLPGLGAGPEAVELEPTGAAAGGRSCGDPARHTIAASPHVRVFTVRRPYSTAVEIHACRSNGRHGSQGLRLPAPAGPAPRIVGDRWLLVLGAGSPASGATVYDMRTARAVVRTADDVREATLLHDGTLAWLRDGGGVVARAPGDPAETQLAPSEPAPSALASGGHTIFWTAGGAPHGFRHRPGAPPPPPSA